MIKKAWAVWKGGIKDGGGTISTETGVLKELGFRPQNKGIIRRADRRPMPAASRWRSR
jgi:hypothetical protein